MSAQKNPSLRYKGKSATPIRFRTVHKNSDGSDHTFINQDLKDTASPTFGGVFLQDGKKLTFGTNKDAEMYFDGTNLIINPNAIGGGYANIKGTMIVDDQLGVGTNTPDSSAIVDFSSTTQGILIPRMRTSQIDSITNPLTSLMVYDIDEGQFKFYDGTYWKSLAGTFKGSVTLSSPIYPPQITINTDNYNPDGLDKTNAIYVSTSGSRSLTGLQAPVPAVAQIIWLFNYGGSSLQLKDDDSSSLVGNRFLLGANKTVQGNESISLVYDPDLEGLTEAGWRAGGIVI